MVEQTKKMQEQKEDTAGYSTNNLFPRQDQDQLHGQTETTTD